MGLIEKISKIWKPAGNEDTQVSASEKAAFKLIFRSVHIGTLWIENSIWNFEYSEDYRNNNQFYALIDFPDKNRVYQSNDLWPFFVHRIPGLKQPAVQEILRLEQINPQDEVQLLRRFGKQTISNPYILQPV